MCSRYSQTKEKVTFYIGNVQISFGFAPRYNIAPSQKVSVIVERAEKIQPEEMTWGWKPVWSKSLLINGQAKTVMEKPTFKKYLHQRCLVPADGFYEWTPDKSPIRFTKPRDELFCMAGLWLETQSQKLDEPVTERKFIILTATPNKTVGRVHNRMPLTYQIPEGTTGFIGPVNGGTGVQIYIPGAPTMQGIQQINQTTLFTPELKYISPALK